MAGESKLQTKCRKEAESYGVLFRKIHAEGRGGWPDILLIFPTTGEVVFVEMKNPNKKGKVSALQQREHKRIMARGAKLYICYAYDYFCEILKRHLK